MKNYTIEKPDALYAPGQKVYWMPEFNHDLIVRDFQWDTLKQTWTYFLTQEDGTEFNTAAPESEIEPRTAENTRARIIKRAKAEQKKRKIDKNTA